MISQDPITIRFIEAFQWLKENGKVRSARQFALGIETYPQSLNDILKGRRDATLPMIQKITEVFHVNCQYLLTGQGNLIRSDVNGISRSPQSLIKYIKAHEFSAYAAALNHDNLDSHVWTSWQLPEEMIGQNIDIAVQCNTDRVGASLRKGDVLFGRNIPREAWKSSMSSKRVYIVALRDCMHIVCISTNDAKGIYLGQSSNDLPDFLPFEDIQQVWSVISRWSPSVKTDEETFSSTQYDVLTKQLHAQHDAISHLHGMVAKLANQNSTVSTY